MRASMHKTVVGLPASQTAQFRTLLCRELWWRAGRLLCRQPAGHAS
jgi:hypothetical protein